MTRSLNTQADFIRSATRFLENVEVLPTSAGDPLLAGMDVSALGGMGVVLSAQAAQRLDVKAKDTLRMRIARRMNGVDQQAVVELGVFAVLPGDAYERPAAFVQPALLRDMEWYRDGFAIASMGAEDGQPVNGARQRFARARIYATDLDAVEGLEQSLIDRRIETSSRLADIRNLKAINHLLTTVFSIISSLRSPAAWRRWRVRSWPMSGASGVISQPCACWAWAEVRLQPCWRRRRSRSRSWPWGRTDRVFHGERRVQQRARCGQVIRAIRLPDHAGAWRAGVHAGPGSSGIGVNDRRGQRQTYSTRGESA